MIERLAAWSNSWRRGGVEVEVAGKERSQELAAAHAKLDDVMDAVTRGAWRRDQPRPTDESAHPRAGAAQQRWDDGPTASSQAPGLHH